MPTRYFVYSPVTVEIRRPLDTLIRVVEQYGVETERTDGFYPTYMENSDGESRQLALASIEVHRPDRVEGTTMHGNKVVARPTEPEDAVAATNIQTTFPIPVRVIGASLRGVAVNNELMAVVDDEGDVMTLMLVSAVGSYLRYSGTWIELTDPNTIDGLNAVPVKDEAIDVYDPIDQAGLTIHIMSLPMKSGTDYAIPLAGPTATVVAAARGELPVIYDDDDVEAAIAAATDVPEYQWYVTRRIRALGLDMELPWEVTVP